MTQDTTEQTIQFKASALYYATLRSLKNGDRGVVHQGGQWSGKTVAILQALATIAHQEENKVITVTSESMPHLKAGAMQDFEKFVLPYFGQYITNINRTDFVYTFDTGSKIRFRSFDTEGSALGAKRDYLYVNEANRFPETIFFQLNSRSEQTIIDYNPATRFYAHEQLIGAKGWTTYYSDHRHNSHLTQAKHEEIESYKDPERFKVYARGITGNVDGLVYPEWIKIPDEQFFAATADTPFIGGQDYGYTNDPSAAVKVCMVRGDIYVQELCYEPGIPANDLNKMWRLHGADGNVPIYSEHDPDMVIQLQQCGLLVYPARKNILAGIQRVKEFKIFYNESSLNITREKERYSWMKHPLTGAITNKPIDQYNHCFIGETLITTNEGHKQIKDIASGDIVLTSNGYRRVLIKWNNGLKQTFNYCLQFDTFSVNLQCTPEHLIKTETGWIQISQLQSGQTVYLNKHSTERCIGSIQKKDIFQEGLNVCTPLYGSILTAKSLRGFMYIMLMKILGTTALKTLNSRKVTGTLVSISKSAGKKILNGLRDFMQQVSKLQKIGINPQMVLSGTNSTQLKIHSGNLPTGRGNVKIAEANTLRKAKTKDSAIITARLVRIDAKESSVMQVYDLTVAGQHEYFANDVLVHNCMDAVRYAIYSHYYKE